MEHRIMYRFLMAVVFVLVSAGITLAHEVKIDHRAKLGNGPELQPGTYRLELMKTQDTSEAAFYQGGDLVTRVPITISVEPNKSRQTEVHYELLDGGHVINQIRVEGWKERLVFSERAQTPVVAE